MKPQPLLFLGEKRRRALIARAVEGVRRWRTAWFEQSSETFEAHCEAPGAGGYVERVAAISTSCWALDIASERQAVLLLPHSTLLWAVHETGATISETAGTAGADTIAEKLEQEVATSLFTELCAERAEPIAVTRVGGDALADWSRASRAWSLQFRALAAGRTFTLLVSAQRLEMLAPARAVSSTRGLASRREAVGSNSLSLRAIVGELDMSVGEIANIAIDDVLVLDQKLSEPVALLASPSRIAVAAGHLGRAGARRAVKVASIPANKI